MNFHILIFNVSYLSSHLCDHGHRIWFIFCPKSWPLISFESFIILLIQLTFSWDMEKIGYQESLSCLWLTYAMIHLGDSDQFEYNCAASCVLFAVKKILMFHNWLR